MFEDVRRFLHRRSRSQREAEVIQAQEADLWFFKTQEACALLDDLLKTHKPLSNTDVRAAQEIRRHAREFLDLHYHAVNAVEADEETSDGSL